MAQEVVGPRAFLTLELTNEQVQSLQVLRTMTCWSDEEMGGVHGSPGSTCPKL
jgi:hypothetical protein